jgi:hypothetical protein
MKFFGNVHKIVNHLVKAIMVDLVVLYVNQQNVNALLAFYVLKMANVFHVLHVLLPTQPQHAILVKF